jgi:hypothetical protein
VRETKKQPTILISTAYLPPIEYFLRILNADKVIIEHEETYSKQTFRNRCEIYSANGKLALIIPVIRTFGNHTKIRDIKIDYSVKWQQEHWRAIVSAYNHSPFFQYFRDVFEPFFEQKYVFLLDFNSKLLDSVLTLISDPKEICHTRTYYKILPEDALDLRSCISPKVKPTIQLPVYKQVFGAKFGFLPNLSIVDLLFNAGPETAEKLSN